MRRFHFALMASAIILATSSLVRADGCVFREIGPEPDPEPILMPDQSAIIRHDGRTQVMAIESHFDGKGDDFAWMVPVPGEAEVEPVSPGTMAVMRLRNGREVYSGELMPPVLAVLVGLAVVWWIVPKVVGSLMPAATRWVLTSSTVVGALMLMMFLLPSLSGSGNRQEAAVAVAREVIGTYDVAHLAPRDAASLKRWLADNQFQVDNDPAITEAVTQYIQDGWQFVAVKLNREDKGAGRLKPHPLKFTFASNEPVYPFRLTGAGMPAGEALTVDLFVYGKQRAAVEGWEVRRCVENLSGRSRWDSTHHDGIEALRGGMPVLTHLRATLSPAEMKRDAAIRWAPYSETRPFAFTRSSAALIVLTGLAAVMLLLVVDAARVAAHPVSRRVRPGSIVAGACVCALIGYVLMPKASGVMERSLEHVDPKVRQVGERYGRLAESGDPVTLEAMQKELAEVLALSREKLGDGPDQYYVRVGEEKRIELVYVTASGAIVLADRYGPEKAAAVTRR